MTTRHSWMFAVLAIVILTSVSLAGDVDGGPSSEYESHDAAYLYTTWGSGTVESPYGSTVENMESAFELVFIQSALEGYPVRTIDSVGRCSADTLIIPESVTSVGNDAFRYSSTERLVFLGDRPSGHIPDDIEVSALEGTDGWGDTERLRLETYADGRCSFTYFCLESGITIHRWISGTDVTIPEYIGGVPVTRIGDLSFMDSPVISISFPKSVNEIGVRSFYECTEMVSAPLPQQVSVIGDEAFRFCPVLESVDLHGTRFIGFEAFRQCYSIPSITIPDSVTDLRDGAFYLCRNAKSVELGSGIGNIPARTFGYMDSLESIDFKNNPKTIGDSAFYNDFSLIRIDCSETKSIGNNAFHGCKYLMNPETLDSVETIHDGAFSDCKSLKEITIGDKLTVLGAHSFDGCRSLETIHFIGEMPEIGTDAIPPNAIVHCLSDKSQSWSGYDGPIIIDQPEVPEEDTVSTTIVALAIMITGIVIIVAIILYRKTYGRD